MVISEPCVVTLTWVLADAQGSTIDELDEPTEFFFGGDDLLEVVEDALAGQAAGFEAVLHLEPEQAFGEYRPDWVCYERRSLFPDDVEAGMQFEGLPEGAQTPDMPADLIYTVTEVYPEHVVLDGNHPLSGVALQLALKVVAVREASDEEVRARSVGEDDLGVSIARPTSARLH